MRQGSPVRFLRRLGNGFYRFQSSALLAGLAATGLLATLTGCGGFFQAIKPPTTTTGSTTDVYVTNIGSGGTGGTLSAYSLTSGVLTALSGSPYTLPATPTSLVVSPNNNFVYVGTNLGIFLYTRSSDGTLTEGNTNTIIYLGPSYPVQLAMDSTSSWLIVANNNSTELDALAIDPTTGIPTSVTPASVTLSNPTPLQIAISPANGSVLVALGPGGTNIWAFSPSKSSPWGSTRTTVNLAKNDSNNSSGSTAANAVAVDSTSKYLFIAEATSNTTSDRLRVIDLATVSTEVDYATGKGPSAILPDLGGNYVYVTNETDNTITGFSLSAGALTALTDSPFSTGKAPVAIAEDSTKSYVLDIGIGTNPNLWIYSFDSTSSGTLDVTKTASTGSTDPSLSNAIALTH